MKILHFVAVFALVMGCKDNKKSNDSVVAEEKESKVMEESKETFPFYVGTYTRENGEGIYQFELTEEGQLSNGKLIAKTDNPSYLAFSADAKHLLAVNESKEGTVSSFKIEKDTLLFVNKSASGGAHPCFIVSNEEGYVVNANYSSGTVGLHKLDENGKLSDLLDVQKHEGKGTHGRQEGPHAHSVWLQPSQNEVIAVDLGTNELWFSKIDGSNNKLEPKAQTKLAMADGAGPRHMAFHPNGKFAFVLNELDNTVTTLALKNGTYEIVTTISSLPKDFTDKTKAADIHISSDGNYLYASNRGHNSIAIFKVLEEGSIEIVGYEGVRGDGPRNFSFSPDEKFLLVANQFTNNIISFKRNEETGKLTFIDEIEAPSPVCILFKN
ncbi:lactonase family protein [Galbibacter mesophilus]|uniref:lactonase family protein n=1 Tax=Galbibacter mesophilus TaxID=379069 RepID=UPI00191D2477|nr:lactonase family protein [Galbibacter mesophilus]MCM5663013.1 lactonase family protein [Galbibacter mesophilus]